MVSAAALFQDGARAMTIRFAHQVAVTQNVTDPANLLGAPDAMISGFTGPSLEVPGDATLSDFSDEQTDSTAGLALLLGISEAALLAADACCSTSTRPRATPWT